MIYNTGESTESLRNKYNPDNSNLRKAQLRMVDMLVYLDKVCKDNNIDYVLSSGNIIGAIRHEGHFIPWDDDMDVYIKRSDRKKLEAAIINTPHPQYVLQNHNTDNGYLGDWPVLRDTKSEYIQDSNIHYIRKYKGLQIDIFPLEEGLSLPIQKLGNLLSWYLVRRNINLGHIKLARFFYSITSNLIFPLILGLCKLKHDDYYYSTLGSSWYKRYRKSDIFPQKPILFEGKYFSGPSDPISYLKSVYGDYTKLPPADQRDHHQATCNIW